MHPIILLIILVAGFILVHWLKRAPKAQRNKVLLYVAIGVLVVLVLTGRAHWMYAAILGAVPLLQRLMGAARMFGMFRSLHGVFNQGHSRHAGRQSDIETRFFRVTLDHDSGEMSGKVTAGQFIGRSLEELTLAELLGLRSECMNADDLQSVQVLEAYLDRRHGNDWRDHNQSAGSGALQTSRMTPAEAQDILGLDGNASRDDIVNAHRRLMQKMHPDRGGSTYLAARINQAKDLLLKK